MKAKYGFVIIVLLFTSIIGSGFIPKTSENNTDTKYVLSAGEGWLTGWGYRIEYNITGVAGAGTDYQVLVNVSYLPFMQTDFDDIRFTDKNGSTLLDHWLMYKSDSTYAEFWIEIRDNITSGGNIYMYCDNDGASSSSDGEATFIFFDDFNDGSLNLTDWTIYSGAAIEANGYLELTGTSTVHSDYQVSFARAVGTRSYFKESRSICGFVNIADYWDDAIMTNTEGDYLYSRENTATTEDAHVFVQDTWQYQEVRWYSGDLAKAFVNHAEVASVNSNVPSDSMRVYMYTNEPDDELLRTDWVYLRKCAASEPLAVPVGEWTDVGDLEFVFHIGWDPAFQFGYDAFFIFAGLIMIPASTMYFVRGGKEDMSRDKLFYFLIAFMMGWALLIGGIMP